MKHRFEYFCECDCLCMTQVYAGQRLSPDLEFRCIACMNDDHASTMEAAAQRAAAAAEQDQ
jgi:hypothetical protein